MEKELTRGLKARVGYSQEESAPSHVVLGFWGFWGSEYAKIRSRGTLLLSWCAAFSVSIDFCAEIFDRVCTVNMESALELHGCPEGFVVICGAMSNCASEQIGESIMRRKGWRQLIGSGSYVD